VKRSIVALLAVAAGVLAGGCASGFGGAAKDITATTATLTGAVGSDRSEPGTYFFRYGPPSLENPSYPSTTPTRSIQYAARRGHVVSEPVAGLQPATAYHFQVCADDQQRLGPFCGPQRFFATTAPAGQDSATGAGIANALKDECGGLLISTAHSDADGRNLRGQARLCDFGIGEPLTCLRVQGNVALLVFPTGRTRIPYFTLRLTDNGAAQDTVEFAAVRSDCSTLAVSNLEDLDFEGELTVIDAQPASR
jgi:hypothetical protein